MALQDFSRFVSDFKGVAALIGKAAIVAPFLAMLLDIGPPWPARTGVPALTALCEVFVLIYVFQFHTPLSRKRIAKRLRLFFVLLVLSGLLYVSLYSFFVFDVPVTSERDLKGFVVQPAIAEMLGPGRTLESLLEGAEWDPFSVWEGWTIYAARVALLASWILFFVGIAGSIGVFVTLQRKGVRAPVAAVPVPP